MFKLSEKSLASLIITVLFCVFILPVNERIAFSLSAASNKQLVIAGGLKLLFGIFLYCLTYFVLNFIERLKKRDPLYIQWLKYSSVYFGVMLVFFLLMYPGHWVWDEFNILNVVKLYVVDAWQNYFTNIFYTFSLYLIPTGVSIVLFQITFASIVVGYITSQARRFLSHKRYTYILFALFLLPPIILNNFYPLRLTMYSYLELLLIAKLLFLYFDKFKTSNKYRQLLTFSVLITLVSFWRTEGIYYLLVFPALVVALNIFTRQQLRNPAPYIFTAMAAAIIVFGFAVTRLTQNDRYNLTGVIGPLSIMLQQPLKGDHLDQRLQNMDKVVDIQLIKQNPDYEEVPAFWKGAVRPDYAQHMDLFTKEYIQLIEDNPDAFMEARLKTFMSTNGFGYKTAPMSVGMLSSNAYKTDKDAVVARRFLETNLFSQPLNVDIKRDTVESLQFFDKSEHFTFLGHVFWNVIPTIILLVIIGIWKLVKRQYFWVLLIALVLARAPLIFITAPANYFMYYLPVYMSGYFLVLMAVLLWFDKRQKKQPKTHHKSRLKNHSLRPLL